MKIVVVLIYIFLFSNIVNGHKQANKAKIDTEQCQKQLKTLNENLDFYHTILLIYRVQSQIQKQKDLIIALNQIDDKVKEPINIIFEGFQNMNIQNNIFELRMYKHNYYPTDIQAIAFYDYLNELHERLLQLQKLINQSGLFFQGFLKSKQIIVNNYEEIISQFGILKDYPKDKVQSELRQLEKDYRECSGQPYRNKFNNMISQSIKSHKAKTKKRMNKLNFKLEDSFVFLEAKPTWDFIEKPPINQTDCGGKLERLNEEYIELLKIQESLIFISRSKETNELIRKLQSFENKFLENIKIINTILNPIIIQKIEALYINDILKFRDISSQKPVIAKVNQLMHSIKVFINELEKLSQQIIDVKLLFTFGDIQYDEIISLNYRISLVIQNFPYQPQQIYQKLLEVDRDYKICRGTQKYEIIKDIKLPSNLQQEKPNNIIEIVPPIKQELCSEQLPQLQETLYQTIKYKILKQIHDFYGHLAFSIEKIFEYSFGDDEKRKYDYRPVLEEFTNKFERNIIQKFDVYLPNYKPDDSNVVDAYESLKILNNKLWVWQNSFDSAKEFLNYKSKDLKNLSEEFDSLEKAIYQINQQIDHYKFVSYYVREQEYVEQLRDYKICKGRDFLEEKMINFNLNQLLQEQQNQKKFIQVKPQNNLIRRTKKPKNSKKVKKQDLQDSNILTQQLQITSFLQQQSSSSEDEENECQPKLENIKEDILQFLKIKTLFKYKIQHQKAYNTLITNFLKVENIFLENKYFFKKKMDWVRIEGRVLEFKFDFPKPKQLNDPIEETLNKLNSFNNKLILLRNAYSNAKSMFAINKDDFSEVRYNNYILNEYLDKNFQYQPEKVDEKLKQLYGAYLECTGRQYQFESEEIKRLKIPSALLQLHQTKKRSRAPKLK